MADLGLGQPEVGGAISKRAVLSHVHEMGQICNRASGI